MKIQFQTFLNKKNQIFGFPCCSMENQTDARLIMTKPGWFLFLRIGQNLISKLFGRKKLKIFGFLCCRSHEDLAIDVSITNLGLILTKLKWFQLFSASQNSISNFFLKYKFLSFHAVVATREDLTIDVSITNVGLISKKTGWFLFLGYGQNSIANRQFWTFLKKINIIDFPCCT